MKNTEHSMLPPAALRRGALGTAVRILAAAALLGICLGGESQAAFDIDALGVPKFVNVVYIELPKITRISKFRSYVGHDYSDSTQFSGEAVKDAKGRIESCRSMKHYFIAPDASVNIFSPVAGTVTALREEFLGTQVEIKSDVQPDFSFVIFHIGLSSPLALGDHLDEGQRLGTHGGSATYSDMAVWVQTPNGKHLISYLETLTDAAIAPIKARGLASPSDAIISKDQRDADLTGCAGFNNPKSTEYLDLTGGAATQVISLKPLPAYQNVGDPPLAISATATSGLPVTISAQTPKVCAVVANTVTMRRAGICKVTLNQSGDATTFAANPYPFATTVLPKGTAFPDRPRLGAIYPPSPSGPQSYLRFYNSGGVSGTVTVSLFDGATGQSIAKWKSPPIATNASVQYGVATLESAAVPGFVRPSSYGLKVEPETTIFGVMQHVVFDPAAEAISNFSTCDTGVTASAFQFMNVHSTRLDAGYASSMVYNNLRTTESSAAYAIFDANDGALLGRFYSCCSIANLVPPSGALTLDMAVIESSVQVIANSASRVKIPPGPAVFHYNLRDETRQFNPSLQDYHQHLVTNKKSGLIADMTTACALDGQSSATIPPNLRSGSVFSSSQTVAQSFLRFYNSGTTAGPVSVTLYDTTSGQAFGPWVSPSIPAGSEQQYSIASIEAALAIIKRSTYGLMVQADIDASFQNVLWRAPDGAVSNLSTCAASVTADQKTLMAVHSSVMSKAGYPSTVVVNNTGSAATKVRLNLYDARDGTIQGSYLTPTIPANGHLKIDVDAIEAAAAMQPGGGMVHYIIKAEDPFTGFLQHLVNNQSAGVVTDMTTSCML